MPILIGPTIAANAIGGAVIKKVWNKKKPKKPEKSNEQLALERRQRSMLDDEIEETEDLSKALARGKLGRASLLSGAPRSASEAANGRKRSGGTGGVGSLLGTGSNTSGGTTTRSRTVNSLSRR